MTDRKKRREEKARRARTRQQSPSELDGAVELLDEVRAALDSGEPIELLGMVSMMILATDPANNSEAESTDLRELVGAFIGTPLPETTALLAALSELLDDGMLAARCRHALVARHDAVPAWLAQLQQTTVRQAMLMTHVLGDADELILGVQFADGREMSSAVHIDHLQSSAVKDAFFVPESINTVLTVAKASNDDPDTSFVELPLDQAAARLRDALNREPAIPGQVSDTWPNSRALLSWVAGLLPDSENAAPQHISENRVEFVDRFFAALVGLPFNRPGYRALLDISIDAGTGDPLRWSSARLARLLAGGFVTPELIPAEVQADLPRLLRAYVPFAHAEAGIRDELTAEALAAIDEFADDYRASVLDDDQLD